MQRLRLEIVEYESETCWSWRLLDDTGAFLADHRTELDRSSFEYGGFTSLPEFVRWNEESGAEEDGGRVLVERVAEWIRRETLGPIAEAILDRAEDEPTVVLVEIPAAAEVLLYRPFELAFLFAPTPSARDVSLVFETSSGDGGRRKQNGKPAIRLRMLAIFSAPTDQAALNVRYERRELRQLIKQLGLGEERAIELRVAQYGVTRELLEDILDEGEGWDIIHFSGHGLPSGLVLENEDGSASLIPSTEFADLLRPARARLKLVSLISCESGAAAATHSLQTLGVAGPRQDPPSRSDEVVDEGSPLPAVAKSLTDQLGCAVLAMRYPVDDDFAVRLSADLYDGLLGHGQGLPRALQRSLQKASATGGDLAALSLATPALFGSPAIDLVIDAPRGRSPADHASGPKLAYFEPEPEHFVGRVKQLARASAALAPKSPIRTVVFHGMAGAGKTACALELAYRHEERRFSAMAWYRAPSEGHDIEGALAHFATVLDLQLDGFELAHVVGDEKRLLDFLPRVSHQMANRSLLIVLDNAESLLTPEGTWRDERWSHVVDALTSHGGLSRLVLTTRVPPRSLRDRPQALIESIHSLSAGESALLARQMPNLGRLISDDAEIGQPAGRALVRRTLEIVQGNPKLIQLADHQAVEAPLLEARIAEADDAWAGRADLGAFFQTGDPDSSIDADDFLRVIEGWTDEIAKTLPPETRELFQILCCLEPQDRRLLILSYVNAIWTESEVVDREGAKSSFAELADRGLIDIESIGSDDEIYRLHSAVEQAVRRQLDSGMEKTVASAMTSFWDQIHAQAAEQGNPHAIAHSCLSSAPYHLRLGRAEPTAAHLGQVVSYDPAPDIIAKTLPLLRRALALADTPSVERRVRLILMRVQSTLGSPVRDEIRELIAGAEEEGDHYLLYLLRGDLVNDLIRTGGLIEAKEVLESQMSAETEAEIWATVSSEGRLLQVMQALGQDEDVLAKTPRLLERIDEAEVENRDRPDRMPWSLRETVLSTASAAAAAIGNWSKALELNEAIRESEMARSAAPIERTRTDFNSVPLLIQLKRHDEAEASLRRIREVSGSAGDLQLLGAVYEAWASLEEARGHFESAVAFSRKGLQTAYTFGAARSINVGHHNLATNLERAGGEPAEVIAHRLAEVLISYQTDSGDYGSDVRSVARTLALTDGEGLPRSFAELCEYLETQGGVDFADLFDRLPAKSPDGNVAMNAIFTDVKKALEDAYGPSDEKPAV